MSESVTNEECKIALGGVYPPITTPFARDGSIAYGTLGENLARWHAYGLAGYVVLGSNGETPYLSEQEKVRLLEEARRAIPAGKLMIAGTGCESARQTMALTAEAAHIGADAALVITPHFFGMRPDNLIAYYHRVADVSPIPVILYNVPKFTHIDMDAATIATIAEHPNVIGIKDSGGNITKIADVVRRTGPAFQVLAGSAGFLFASLTVGAVGGVVALANIAPQQAIDIYELHKAGRWDDAAALQRRMIPVNTAITAQYGVPGLKAALEMVGWYGGPVRLPLLELGAGERQALHEVLVAGGVL